LALDKLVAAKKKFEMLRLGLARPADGPWASQLHLVLGVATMRGLQGAEREHVSGTIPCTAHTSLEEAAVFAEDFHSTNQVRITESWTSTYFSSIQCDIRCRIDTSKNNRWIPPTEWKWYTKYVNNYILVCYLHRRYYHIFREMYKKRLFEEAEHLITSLKYVNVNMTQQQLRNAGVKITHDRLMRYIDTGQT
jgi:hypothetical protein